MHPNFCAKHSILRKTFYEKESICWLDNGNNNLILPNYGLYVTVPFKVISNKLSGIFFKNTIPDYLNSGWSIEKLGPWKEYLNYIIDKQNGFTSEYLAETCCYGKRVFITIHPVKALTIIP